MVENHQLMVETYQVMVEIHQTKVEIHRLKFISRNSSFTLSINAHAQKIGTLEFFLRKSSRKFDNGIVKLYVKWGRKKLSYKKCLSCMTRIALGKIN